MSCDQVMPSGGVNNDKVGKASPCETVNLLILMHGIEPRLQNLAGRSTFFVLLCVFFVAQTAALYFINLFLRQLYTSTVEKSELSDPKIYNFAFSVEYCFCVPQ